MPDQLKSHINKTWSVHCAGQGAEKEARCPQLRMVWTSCEGETQADEENMGGVTYTPWQGFPGSVLHSHWSRLNEARLSLVESFIVLLRQCL